MHGPMNENLFCVTEVQNLEINIIVVNSVF